MRSRPLVQCWKLIIRKIVKKIYSIVLISAALLSCTDNSEQLNRKSLRLECYSKGYNDNYEACAAVRDFSMFVMNGNNSYNNVTNPVHVIYSSNKWNFTEVKLTETTADIYAFSPQTNNISPENIELSLTPLTDYLASGKYTAKNTQPDISIEMDHILSKINMIINGNKVTSIKAKNIPTTGSYNILTGNISKDSSTGIVSGNEYIYIFPSTTVLNFEIVYNLQNYTYTASSKEYMSGREYTYDLKLDGSGNLSIDGDVTTRPWEPGKEYDETIQL